MPSQTCLFEEVKFLLHPRGPYSQPAAFHKAPRGTITPESSASHPTRVSRGFSTYPYNCVTVLTFLLIVIVGSRHDAACRVHRVFPIVIPLVSGDAVSLDQRWVGNN